MALHLLDHCPDLAITPDAQWRSPVVALANSKVFASVGELKFWQRWIYDRQRQLFRFLFLRVIIIIFSLSTNSIVNIFFFAGMQVPNCAKNHVSLDVQNLNDSLSHKDITVISSGIFRRFGAGKNSMIAI